MTSESLLSRVFSRQPIVTAAGIAAAAFIGYCIYSNHKIRSAPDFRQRIRETFRRATARQQRHPIPSPNAFYAAEVQGFFFRELQLCRQLLENGNIEGGVEHLCNVGAILREPLEMGVIFVENLTNEQFDVFLRMLGEATARLKRIQNERSHAGNKANASDGPVEGLTSEA